MTKQSLINIWLGLLLLLGLSLLLGSWGHVVLATSLIFTIALLKAGLVVYYYMGLKWEPKYIALIILSGILCLILLYFALVPDIVYRYGG